MILQNTCMVGHTQVNEMNHDYKQHRIQQNLSNIIAIFGDRKIVLIIVK